MGARPQLKFFKNQIQYILEGKKTLEPRPRSDQWIKKISKADEIDLTYGPRFGSPFVFATAKLLKVEVRPFETTTKQDLIQISRGWEERTTDEFIKEHNEWFAKEIASGYAVVDANYTDASQMLSKTDNVRGYIYVLSSKSVDSKITTVKNLYKIGYSTTPIATRIKNAQKDPTYLMAPVEVVSSYIVTNEFNPQKIEYFLHRIFAEAALNINVIGPDGREYKPLEWFSVPLDVIDMAVNLLQSGEIVDYVYDLSSESLVLTN